LQSVFKQRKMNQKKIAVFTIPNIITLLNLLSGCIAVVLAFQDKLVTASILIFIAGIFDFLDGMAARLLKAYSELGKQLDSLADIVSFGIAPSSILFGIYLIGFKNSNPDFNLFTTNIQNQIILFSSFIIALFSALRLAKFNIDDRQSDSFIGVPTPANGFLIASLPFIIKDYPTFGQYLTSAYILIPLSIILSILLISEIPLMSLKFKNLRFSENKNRYLLVISSIVLLTFFQISSFPIIFLIYLMLSLMGQKGNQK
jgi:CDP-diacylglycerol---serine O-phosphatidyltransferase